MPITLNKTKVLLLPGTLTRASWKEVWQAYPFRMQCFGTLIAGLLLALLVPAFLNYIQTIQSHSLHDILLDHLPAQDMSGLIFILLYGTLLLALINLIYHPDLLLQAIQAYLLLTVMRMCCIYFYPLEPDKNIIPLSDPFVDQLFYQRVVITKDLFFSGHVSTLALLYFMVPFPVLKKIILVVTVLVAFLILLQHVHYAIDVLMALPAAYLAYRIAKRYSKRWGLYLMI